MSARGRLFAALALLTALAGCGVDPGGGVGGGGSGTEALVERSRSPLSGAVALCGLDHEPRMVLVGAQTSVLTLDLADPDNPRVRDQLVLGQMPGRLAQSNGLTLAACGAAGVAVIDADNPDLLRVRSWLPVEDVAVDVAWIGTTAIVADRERGLRVYDVASPALPELLAIHDLDLLPGAPWLQRIAVSGRMVFVLDCFAGLLAVDLTDPESPFVVGSLETDCGDQLLALDGRLVLEDQLEGEERLRVVEAFDPASMQEAYVRGADLRFIDALAGTDRSLLVGGSDGQIDWLQLWRIQAGGLPVFEGRVSTQGEIGDMLRLAPAGEEWLLCAEGAAGVGIYAME